MIAVSSNSKQLLFFSTCYCNEAIAYSGLSEAIFENQDEKFEVDEGDVDEVYGLPFDDEEGEHETSGGMKQQGKDRVDDEENCERKKDRDYSILEVEDSGSRDEMVEEEGKSGLGGLFEEELESESVSEALNSFMLEDERRKVFPGKPVSEKASLHVISIFCHYIFGIDVSRL